MIVSTLQRYFCSYFKNIFMYQRIAGSICWGRGCTSPETGTGMNETTVVM